MDYPSCFESNINRVIESLEKEGELSVKLLSGSLGQGFYKFSCKSGRFYINEKIVEKKK